MIVRTFMNVLKILNSSYRFSTKLRDSDKSLKEAFTKLLAIIAGPLLSTKKNNSKRLRSLASLLK